MTDCISDVTATLLYAGTLPVVDGCIDHGLTSMGFAGSATGWTNGTLNVSWTCVPAPCPAAEFFGALSSEYMQGNHGGLANAVERHRNHIRIHVTGDADTLDKLTLLHAVTRLAARAAMPMALHWPASGQLLTGPQYMALAGVSHPWALFVRPVIRPAGTDANGRPLNRLDLIGAHRFAGVDISLAPTALDRSEMLRIALGALQHLVETRQTPHDTMLMSSRTARIEGRCKDGHLTLIAHCRTRDLPVVPVRTDPRAGRSSKLRVAIAATGAAACVALCVSWANMAIEPRTTGYMVAKVDVTVLPSAN